MIQAALLALLRYVFSYRFSYISLVSVGTAVGLIFGGALWTAFAVITVGSFIEVLVRHVLELERDQ